MAQDGCWARDVSGFGSILHQTSGLGNPILVWSDRYHHPDPLSERDAKVIGILLRVSFHHDVGCEVVHSSARVLAKGVNVLA
jgi:hypothetical protein